MIFGADHPWATDGRAATLQTPGGTGGLRVAGDFLKQKLTVNRIWLSQPTWENHRGVFSAAGLEVGTYTYFDAARNCLDLDGMLASLGRFRPGKPSACTPAVTTRRASIPRWPSGVKSPACWPNAAW